MINCLVFGASSDIACELLGGLKENGVDFLGVVRSLSAKEKLLNLGFSSENLLVLPFEMEGIEEAYQEALRRWGMIDAMICFNGQMPSNSDVWRKTENFLDLLQSNVMAVGVVQYLAYKYVVSGGVIAVVSSVAGDRMRNKNYFYGLTKAFASDLNEGIRLQAQKTHAVCDFKLGPVKTRMNPMGGADKKSVAASIYHLLDIKYSGVVYLPSIWRFIMLIIKLIPFKVFKYLKF